MEYAVDSTDHTHVIIARYRGICKDSSLTRTQEVNFAFEGDPDKASSSFIRRQVQAFFNKKYGWGNNVVTGVKIVQIRETC